MVIDKNAMYHTLQIMIIKAYRIKCDRVIVILQKTFIENVQREEDVNLLNDDLWVCCRNRNKPVNHK
jgi:hypothetical protein